MKPNRHLTAGVSKAIALLFAGSALTFGAAAHATPYVQTDLVTDDQAFLASLGYAPAASVDLNLINPWGMSYTPGGSPIWVSDNGTGVSTLYPVTAAGLLGPPNATRVVIPPPAIGGPALPTGQVNTGLSGATDFLVPNGAGGTVKSAFIFATEGGTIAARTAGNVSISMVDNSLAGAVYKGLAIGNSSAGWVLYAADFAKGQIEVFNSHFAPITLAGNFTGSAPPAAPPGFVYAPFNVQMLNGNLYVTYALKDLSAPGDDVAGAGNGYVEEFTLNGNFVRRIATNGVLNSPWGLDIAPAAFGQFANDLLVGNFGDGTINVYDPNNTNVLLGTLTNGNDVIHIDGLWGLINGNGGNSGAVGSVYFAAGIGDEAHGLFGALTATPEPSTLALLAAGLLGIGAFGRRRKVTA